MQTDTRREQERDDRARILEAADQLFYGRGIQAVGMDAVRSASGVPLKRLYACFPSKEALVLEILRKRAESWNSSITAVTAAAETPRGKLLAVYDFLDEWFRQDDFRGCAFINAFGELGGTSSDVALAARTQKQAFHDHLSRLVAELGAPTYLVTQLALLAEGAQTTAAIEGRPEVAAEARAAAEVLIDAAMAR
ncbi:AcrR family transcriptional regulator [Microbacterium sp. AK009]|uniref:TetR/AcrR family transcriptional regulator n=1 Tax=Microbacterium sp. AK009 TaxID=2723068 RepID=UPI0015C8D5FB|nr:TetR/AcrR family transcriptional regulator [Microbacterium sp. AK009]NYF18028.1 AcrR family transcriptional regulator [Microbacterium sp. AK009]